MKLWLFFQDKFEETVPEYRECLKIKAEAEARGAETEIMNPDNIELLVDSSGDWYAMYESRVLELPDIVIPRTGADTSYTSLSVMRFYERLGVTFLNTPRIVETAGDKLHTLQVLAAKGLPVPRTMLGTFPPNMEAIEKNLGFPLIIKTIRGTCGGGVFLAETKDQFKDLTDLIVEANASHTAHFIFQKFIAKSRGKDLRVFVIRDKIHACMQRIAAEGSFKANISKGGKGIPHPITPEIEKLSLRVAEELRLDVTGIDLLFDDNGLVVCEANTTPGFTGLDPACNVNTARAIVDAAIAKWHENQRKGILGFLRLPKWGMTKTKAGKTPAPEALRAPTVATEIKEKAIAEGNVGVEGNPAPKSEVDALKQVINAAA